MYASSFVRVSCVLAVVSLLPVLHPLSSSVLVLGVGVATAVYLLALGLPSTSAMLCWVVFLRFKC